MPRTANDDARRWLPVSCPYCEKPAKRPKPFDELLESQGGRCECGAVYVADEAGSRGGQALVDGLVVLSGGDLDRAMSLVIGRDYELAEVNYDPRTFSVVSRLPGRAGHARAKVFFFRRLGSDPAP